MKEYQAQAIDDKVDIDLKIKNIREFIGSTEYVGLGITERVMLMQQQALMEQYSDILASRIANYNE